jgi:hypothetical protein
MPNPRTPPDAARHHALHVRVARAATLVFALAASAIVLLRNGVPCLFARATHLPCPGCGSTRGVRALMDGDFATLFGPNANPFGPVMAFLLGVFALQAVMVILRDGDLTRLGGAALTRPLMRGLVLVAASETALWVARFFGALGGPVSV